MLIHLMPKEFSVIYFINTESGILIPAMMGFQKHTEIVRKLSCDTVRMVIPKWFSEE